MMHMGGGVAQVVERSLSMREVPGSIPGASNFFFFQLIYLYVYLLEIQIMNKAPSFIIILVFKHKINH